MPPTRKRTFRAALYLILALCALDIALLRFPMVLTRIHVSHLLSDFQSIRPMQSDWALAQRLMRRWHRWGHASDVCTYTDCTYTIAIDDPLADWFSHRSENFMGALANHGVFSWLTHLGWRQTTFMVKFTVQDGIIVRTTTAISLGVSPSFVFSDWNNSYSLMMSAKIHPRLTAHNDIENYGWVLSSFRASTGSADLTVGRPSGCEICMSEEATYTPELPSSEITRITSYNLSCLTRVFHPCQQPEDLLPAARDWHLYDHSTAELPKPALKACSVPAYASGRDAVLAFEGDVLSVVTKPARDPEQIPQVHDEAQIRVNTILKGDPVFQVGSIQKVIPFTEDGWYPYTSEKLAVGQNVIVVAPEDRLEEGLPLALDPCGVIANTPEHANEVRRGIALDVLTRYGDTYDNKPPFYSKNRR